MPQASPLQVTLTVTNGTISLSQLIGLSFTAGDGVADATMTFTGTLADLNAALDGLSFAPTADFNGAANLQIATNDQGNTGAVARCRTATTSTSQSTPSTTLRSIPFLARRSPTKTRFGCSRAPLETRSASAMSMPRGIHWKSH